MTCSAVSCTRRACAGSSTGPWRQHKRHKRHRLPAQLLMLTSLRDSRAGACAAVQPGSRMQCSTQEEVHVRSVKVRVGSRQGLVTVSLQGRDGADWEESVRRHRQKQGSRAKRFGAERMGGQEHEQHAGAAAAEEAATSSRSKNRGG